MQKANLALMFERIEDMLVDDDLLYNVTEWESLNVDYHPPFVKRLYIQIGGVRVSLHKIYPCSQEEALFHPHPWPGNFKIYKGRYYTEIGYSATETPPEVRTQFIMSPGSMARMCHPNEWHLVAPLGDTPTYTMMVTTAPYSNEDLNPAVKKSTKKLSELELGEKIDMLEEFREIIEREFYYRNSI